MIVLSSRYKEVVAENESLRKSLDVANREKAYYKQGHKAESDQNDSLMDQLNNANYAVTKLEGEVETLKSKIDQVIKRLSTIVSGKDKIMAGLKLLDQGFSELPTEGFKEILLLLDRKDANTTD